MPTIYDNIDNLLISGLENSLDVAKSADFCVGYFNLRGWKEIADKIEKFSGKKDEKCRLLIGMQKQPEEIISDFYYNFNKSNFEIDNQTANKLKKDLANNFRNQLTVGIPTEEDEIGLRKLLNQIKSGKVIVKLFLRYPLHAKLYIVYREDKINPIIGFLGSSNLTLAGLLRQGELNIGVLDQDAGNKLVEWFEDKWNDKWCIDISKELIEIIDKSWASEKPYPPYYIYLKIAYHLSQEARAGISEFRIPRIFQKDLLDFQQKAVQIAANHLNKRNGVLIGDVVGLGKTIVACALAKIFEDDFGLETLIICPKNIQRMWEDYVFNYQLRAKVLPISKVIEELPYERRYRILIIDESHNLRNMEGKRYRAIKEYIALNDSKVILLSATPYNKSYFDLSSQLRLFIDDDDDLSIAPENYIRSIGGLIEFKANFQHSERSILAFEKSDNIDDWRELMRLYLIRRTRTFIKENYALHDPEKNRKYLLFNDGRRSYFPDRIVKKVEYNFNPDDPDDQYAKLYSEKVVVIINSLNLPRYGLGNYIKENLPFAPTSEEQNIIQNLSRAGKRLMGFARTSLFKRLESSGKSFLLSINRHILRNFIFLYALKNHLLIPISEHKINYLGDILEEEFGFDYNPFNHLHSTKSEFEQNAEIIYKSLKSRYENHPIWMRSEFFNENLKTHLEEDNEKLLSVFNLGKDWDPAKDKQLKALYDLCTKRHPKDKILIFTQYADTAYYLYNELLKMGLDKLGYVTGNTEDPTIIAEKFSPISNNKPELKNSDEEIRVLISTDVLSEGQNLQDCHIVVNYDLPWAIIKLIQRVGRVDRIGQLSDKILCYSFLPEDGLDKIINLRNRLTARIKQNAELVGSDEIFFEGDPINIADLYHEKSGILEEEEDGEVDLASYAFQIWKNAIEKNPDLEKIIPNLPNVIYSTKKELNENDNQEGVIVYTRTTNDNDVIVMVNKNGDLITQSQFAILKKAECSPDEKALPKLTNHHKLVEKVLDYVKTSEKQFGGQLGKKTSARYRVYMRLNSYYEKNKDTLFANDELKRVIEDLYRYPLKESAKDTFNRQLKAGVDDAQLADLAISLRAEDKLCIINEEEIKRKQPQIICSMGLRII